MFHCEDKYYTASIYWIQFSFISIHQGARNDWRTRREGKWPGFPPGIQRPPTFGNWRTSERRRVRIRLWAPYLRTQGTPWCQSTASLQTKPVKVNPSSTYQFNCHWSPLYPFHLHSTLSRINSNPSLAHLLVVPRDFWIWTLDHGAWVWAWCLLWLQNI